MKTLELKKATESLAKYARALKNGPVVFTTNGKPAAALISMKNTDAETVALCGNPVFMGLIRKSRANLKTRGGVSQEQMRRKLGLAREA